MKVNSKGRKVFFPFQLNNIRKVKYIMKLKLYYFYFYMAALLCSLTLVLEWVLVISILRLITSVRRKCPGKHFTSLFKWKGLHSKDLCSVFPVVGNVVCSVGIYLRPSDVSPNTSVEILYACLSLLLWEQSPVSYQEWDVTLYRKQHKTQTIEVITSLIFVKTKQRITMPSIKSTWYSILWKAYWMISKTLLQS